MASNSCCSWRSFQVRSANQGTETPGPRGIHGAGGARQLGATRGDVEGEGKFEDSVFSFFL